MPIVIIMKYIMVLITQFIVALWSLICFVSILLLIIALVYVFTIEQSPPYFPGDPPAVDLLHIVSGVFAINALIGFTINSVWQRWLEKPLHLHHIIRIIFKVSLIGSLICFVIISLNIGKRHFGQWGKLKNVIRLYSEQVTTVTDLPGRQLTTEQFECAKLKFFTKPVLFTFRTPDKTVEIRMMQTTYPYVGVDFGDGANAVFDPKTMFCVYSD